jgi:hypothetical protein
MENLENFDQIEQENIKRIKQMDEDEIQRSLSEIYERLGRFYFSVIYLCCILDPKTIEFLRNRSTQKTEKPKG